MRALLIAGSLGVLVGACASSGGGGDASADVPADRIDADVAADAPEVIPDVHEVDAPPDLPEVEIIPDAADAELMPDVTDVPDEVEPETTGPCNLPEECDDGDGCTVDKCIDHTCIHQQKNCNDGNKCTEDQCDPATGQCAYDQDPCEDGDPCTLDSCMPTTGCKNEPIPNCCPGTTVAEETFETALSWKVVNEVMPPAATATWQLSTAKAHGGESSLYFGSLENKNYDVGGRVRAYVETADIKLTDKVGTNVRFWIWMDLEKAASYDNLTLFLLHDGQMLPVWAKEADSQMQKWTYLDLDLQTFAGKTVKLRFLFDTVDGNDNAYEGVYIDDFSVAQMCEKGPCKTKVDCSDNLACTNAHCEDGKCTYDIQADCCLNLSDCLDDDPCTIDSCKNNVCSAVQLAPPYCCYQPSDCNDDNECTDDICDDTGICFHPSSTAAGCCKEDPDCDDKDPCTIDSCKDFQCKFVNTCCFSDQECDDGDNVCTTDHCVAGKCVYMPTGAEGCCLSPIFYDDFSTDKGWQYGPEWEKGSATPSSGQSYNGPDPAFDHTSSDDNMVAGVVIGGNESQSIHEYYYLTSPVIDISAAATPQLVFWRWLNSDYLPYMQNDVEAFNGNGWVKLWETGDSPGVADSSWTFVKFDVTKQANKQFQVRFGFRIGSGGVFAVSSWNVDDVMVVDWKADAAVALCCQYQSQCEGLYMAPECVAGTCKL